MNRQEAYEIMKQGRYVTHPILSGAGVEPLFLENDIIYGNHNEPIASEWKNQIDSKIFDTGWIECDEDGNPLNS